MLAACDDDVKMVRLLINEFGLRVTDQDEVRLVHTSVGKEGVYLQKSWHHIFVCKQDTFVLNVRVPRVSLCETDSW